MNPQAVRLVVMAACLTAGALGGCSSITPYPNTLPKNLQVSTKLDGGSVKVAVVFDIHRVRTGCTTEYAGRIDLPNGEIQIGLPVGEPLYLDFIFVTRASFSSATSATRHSTVLTPRSGHEYRAQVSYAKGLYSVEMRESRKGTRTGRIIEPLPLHDCKARLKSAPRPDMEVVASRGEWGNRDDSKIIVPDPSG